MVKTAINRRDMQLAALLATCTALLTGLTIGVVLWAKAQTVVFSVEMSTTADAWAKVYFDIGQELNEAHSVALPVRKDNGYQYLEFVLSRHPIRYIRFDPLDREGQFSLRRVQIQDAMQGLIYNVDLRDVVPLHQVQTAIDEQGALSGTTTEGANDPMLHVKLEYPLTASASSHGMFILSGMIIACVCARLCLLPMFRLVLYWRRLMKTPLSDKLITLRALWFQYRVDGSSITNAAPNWSLVLISVFSAALVLVFFTMHVRRYFFLFDDFALVGLASTKQMYEIFTEGLIGFYRPVTFAFLKLQYALFRWDTPGGYALVSCVLHFVNALLLARLVLLGFPGKRSIAWLSSTVFLLSPWASEAFFWISCQFDLVGTALGLLAISVALQSSTAKTSSSIFCAGIVATAILTCLAVLSKESYVVLPGLFLAFALYRQDALQILRRRRIMGATAMMALSVVSYLILRAHVLPAFTGAYGNYFDLLRNIHPMSLIHSFVIPPIDSSNIVLFKYGRPLLAFLAALTVLLAFASYPRETTVSFFGFACAIIPVLPFGVGLNSTGGGRFIYFAGIFAAIVFAHGLVEASHANAEMSRLAGVAAIALRRILKTLFFSYMAISLGYQQTVWSCSSAIARSCMEQFGRQRHAGTHFHITNLPNCFVQGPYVLKSYAFSYYYPSSNVRVRAERTLLSYENGVVREVGRGPDPFSQYITNANEVTLTLDCGVEPHSPTSASE